jgi:hypothetical protein
MNPRSVTNNFIDSSDLRFRTALSDRVVSVCIRDGARVTLSAFRITLYVISTLGLVTLDIRL